MYARPPVALKQSSRGRLTRHTLPEFAGPTLFDAIGRVVSEAECLPRKELFEAWAVARRVRRRLEGGSVLDLAAGHGLLAWLLLLLDPTATGAVCVDRRRPPSAARLEAAIVARWPRLAGLVRWVEGRLEEAPVEPGALVVSVHACSTLTDRVLDVALAARAPVAVLPCCHSRDKCDLGGLGGWIDVGLAVDVTRVHRLRAAGYEVHTQLIPGEITPQNRLIIARPATVRPEELPRRGGGPAADERHREGEEGRADDRPHEGDLLAPDVDLERLGGGERAGQHRADHGADEADEGRDDEAAQGAAGDHLAEEPADQGDDEVEDDLTDAHGTS